VTPSTPSSTLRRIPRSVWLGAALLTASIAGVAWAFGGNGHGAPDDGPSGSPERTVCFGYVDVRGGVTSLYPVQPGRVVKVHVQENDEVSEKAPLLEVDATPARETLAGAEAELKAAQAQVGIAQAMKEQHLRLVEAQKKAIQAKEAEKAAAEAEARYPERLANSGNGPREKADAARQQVLAVAAAVAVEQARLRALEALDPSYDEGIARAQEGVAAKQAAVRGARYALDQCVVKAPFRGRVLRVNVSVGEVLTSSPKQPALIFCPDERDDPRVIRAEVDQEWAARVQLGQQAEIKDDARNSPDQWKGKVVRISDWFTHRRSTILEPLQFNDVRTLECLIELAPNQKPLRIGQRMRVTLTPPG
jgi:multidrug resistance efflux pump